MTNRGTARSTEHGARSTDSDGEETARCLCSVFRASCSAGCFNGLFGRTGGTLVELLVAMLLLAILGAYAYGFVRAALASVRVQEVRAEAVGVTALALAMWAQEVRLAGFDAAGRRPVGLRVATATALTVATDLNGDGDSDDPHELVAYAYDAARGAVTRATAGGTAQPFATDVAADGLRFRYFDAAGGAVAAPADGLSLDDRRRVRAIRVDLRVALPHPAPSAPGPVPVWATSTVHLRNP